ncbi:MAG: NAD-dependent epimerase/dehydratase family protein [Patescibacteria group bacterium]|nr:NAD-dependent epimerase/dehydratase family protein [Patescibacteria group bacterium]MDE2015246.1 NAD-dependent epimerase/dehydratase family protein [Patescibacteria group bacterium]MDE2227052.1 NAD-dependent epimerase/dehydratase family protein [Patescibacteria group bacterium]
MRILVTGGTGFIGSNLTIELLKLGHDVLITGHDAEQKIPNFHGKYLQPNFLGLDWGALGKIDALFHEAALNDTTCLDEREMMLANVDSSLKLFEHAAKNGCRKIVYASSTAVYGASPAPYIENKGLEPLNPYGRSKLILDEKAMEFAKVHPEITVVGLRYCNVYGPRENHKGKRASMIYQLAKQMKNGNPKIFKNGEQKRDYIYVGDVVRANLLALQSKESGVFNCGFGGATSFNDIIKLLNEVMGLDRVPEYIDNPYADKYQNFTQCDMSLAKKVLGFVPKYNVKDGIKDYFASGFLTGSRPI